MGLHELSHYAIKSTSLLWALNAIIIKRKKNCSSIFCFFPISAHLFLSTIFCCIEKILSNLVQGRIFKKSYSFLCYCLAVISSSAMKLCDPYPADSKPCQFESASPSCLFYKGELGPIYSRWKAASDTWLSETHDSVIQRIRLHLWSLGTSLTFGSCSHKNPSKKVPTYSLKWKRCKDTLRMWFKDSVCGWVPTIRKIEFGINVFLLLLGWYHLTQDIAIF